jgi:hypothetical protein
MIVATVRLRTLFIVALATVTPGLAGQSEGEQFKARITPVPVESSTSGTITGKGSATATLVRTTLTISGMFEGMQSPATFARVHIGGRGIRGPAEFDLTVTKATSGTIAGSLTLTRVQVDSLKRGWFYIQIHAEKAPDGNLWGWLLQ